MLNASDGQERTAVVAAGDEETRILLRGLLRLHHFRVDGEAEGATQALALLRDHHPTLLVTDVNLAEGSSTNLVAEARAVLPTIRVILVAPASRPPPTLGPGMGPNVVLLRPFRIRQFAEAVQPGS
ncbi:MAG TPA: response regulator [Thermoplasmata archaeon]|nr:response regulator [Thermoplasmata archaeon]